MNADGLKSRLWDKQKQSYIDNFVIHPDGTFSIFDFRFHEYTNPLSEDDGYIIERCLGRKDRKGNLIYEGDVLEKTLLTCYCKTSSYEDFRLYKERKKSGLIVEEETNNKFDKLYYVFRTGETDIATMDRFPTYWLKNEDFGWEGEDLQVPKNWVIIGNIHEMGLQNEQ